MGNCHRLVSTNDNSLELYWCPSCLTHQLINRTAIVEIFKILACRFQPNDIQKYIFWKHPSISGLQLVWLLPVTCCPVQNVNLGSQELASVELWNWDNPIKNTKRHHLVLGTDCTKSCWFDIPLCSLVKVDLLKCTAGLDAYFFTNLGVGQPSNNMDLSETEIYLGRIIYAFFCNEKNWGELSS